MVAVADSNMVSSEMMNLDLFGISLGVGRKPQRRYGYVDGGTNFHAGFVSAPGALEEMDVRPFCSYELWWVICNAEYRPLRGRHGFSAGVGVDWKNYRISDKYRFNYIDDKTVLERYPEGESARFSRIKVFSVNFPLAYSYRARHFGFTIEPVVNLNLYSSIKSRYKVGGDKAIIGKTDLHATPVTVDIMGTVRSSSRYRSV